MQSLTQTIVGTRVVRPPRRKGALRPRRRASRGDRAPRAQPRARLRSGSVRPDANAGRGSARAFRPGAGDAARFRRLRRASDEGTFGSDGVIYDPDQFDPANVRSGGVLFTQTADPVGASSLPAPGAGPVSRDDVIAAQNHWANSIVDISRVFLQGGDYVGLAGQRAGELYGYGHSNVLFKPTKASEHAFGSTPRARCRTSSGTTSSPGASPRTTGSPSTRRRASARWLQQPSDRLPRRSRAAMGTTSSRAPPPARSRTSSTFGYKRNSDGQVRSACTTPPFRTSPRRALRGRCLATTSSPRRTTGQLHRRHLQSIPPGRDAWPRRSARGRAVRLRPQQRALQAHQGVRARLPARRHGRDVVLRRVRRRPRGLLRGPRVRHQRQEGLQQGGLQQPSDRLPRRSRYRMGTYEFTCATTGAVSNVEYTFGYKRNSDGQVRLPAPPPFRTSRTEEGGPPDTGKK